MDCPVCGERMSRFKNDDGSDRYVCLKEATLAHQAMARGAKSGPVRARIRAEKKKRK